jgi:hypothetical protein
MVQLHPPPLFGGKLKGLGGEGSIPSSPTLCSALQIDTVGRLNRDRESRPESCEYGMAGGWVVVGLFATGWQNYQPCRPQLAASLLALPVIPQSG